MATIPKEPHTNLEQYLNRIATGEGEYPAEPKTNVEQYLNYIIEKGTGGEELVTELPEEGKKGKLYVLVDDATDPTKAYGVYTYADGWVLIAQPVDQSVKMVEQLPQTGEDGVLYYVPKAGSGDTYDLYRWLNGGWVKVDTDVILYTTTGQNTNGAMTQKAVTDALATKQNTLTFDQAPTQGSGNPVTSGGTYTAIANEATSRSDADTALGNRITNEQGFAKELTTADYDFPTSSPNSVALWKLESGTYVAKAGVTLAPVSGTTYNGGIVFVQKPTAEKTGTIIVFSDSGETLFQDVSTLGASESQERLVTEVINNLTSTSTRDALSAKQGKVLQDTKQDNLTAGSNIQLNGSTISATDTTYTAGSGLNLSSTEFSVDTSVVQSKLTAGSNVQINGDVISATDTTYTAGEGIELTNGEFATDHNVVAYQEDLPTTLTNAQYDALWSTPNILAELLAAVVSGQGV